MTKEELRLKIREWDKVTEDVFIDMARQTDKNGVLLCDCADDLRAIATIYLCIIKRMETALDSNTYTLLPGAESEAG